MQYKLEVAGCRPGGGPVGVAAAVAPGRPCRYLRLGLERACKPLPPWKMRARRPMGDLNAAMRDLDADADQVLALLAEGKLVGFDISARRSRRATIRVLTESLDCYWKTGLRLKLAWPEIFELIWPPQRMCLQGMDIQRCLNCDASHVSAIIRGGHLRAVKNPHAGWGGSSMVTRGAFEAFLRERRLDGAAECGARNANFRAGGAEPEGAMAPAAAAQELPVQHDPA